MKVGALIERTRGRWGWSACLREMVGLLWEHGSQGAALRLEGLWNDLARSQPFALLCGYPVNQLRSGDRKLLGEICAAHDYVALDESRMQSTLDASERAQLTARLERRVQRLERELERRRLLEAQLADREMDLADFLDNAVIGLHKIDANGIVAWANRAELDLLGYAPEEYIGRLIADFVVEAGQADALLKRAASGEVLRDEHVQMRCKDGSTRDVLINSSPLLIDGKFMYTRSSMRDVTAQWSVEGHLRGEAEKWEILHRTGVSLSSDLDLERIVQTVTDAAVQLTGAQFGAFFYNVESPRATRSCCTRCRARRARRSRSSRCRARPRCSARRSTARASCGSTMC